MKEGWTTRWKALLLWLCGYLSFMAFALVGGYVIVKSEDEELKKTAKLILILTLIFTAISMFFSIYNGIGSMFGNYYSSIAYMIYDILDLIVTVVKIAVFVLFAALSFFQGNSEPVQEEPTAKPEEHPTDEEPKE